MRFEGGDVELLFRPWKGTRCQSDAQDARETSLTISACDGVPHAMTLASSNVVRDGDPVLHPNHHHSPAAAIPTFSAGSILLREKPRTVVRQRSLSPTISKMCFRLEYLGGINN